MSLELDLSADVGLEPVTVSYAPGRTQTVPAVDVIGLGWKLREVFQANAAGTDADAAPHLRAVLVAAGFDGLPADRPFAAVALAERLMKAGADRKKKFEETLWGRGDGWPASPDSTADSR